MSEVQGYFTCMHYVSEGAILFGAVYSNFPVSAGTD